MFRLCSLLLWPALASAAVVINEASDKGTAGTCDGEDWIELANTGDEAVTLNGYRLCDVEYCTKDKVLTFFDTQIAAGGYMLLCEKGDLPFKISDGEDLYLYNATQGLIDSTILGGHGYFGQTWARTPDGVGAFKYTTDPTPGAANGATANAPSAADRTEELLAVTAKGAAFFGMDADGKTNLDTFDIVGQFNIVMEETAYQNMEVNASHEQYQKVMSFTYTSGSESVVLGPMEMRTRGFSTLATAECMGLASKPFLLDFAGIDKTQNLFGVTKGYLRNNAVTSDMGLREYLAHRVLARSGLAYLRSRHVDVYINDIHVGLMLFMEAPDQEYVFARSFPNYNRDTYSLYKVKPASLGMKCLKPSTPPEEGQQFVWDRGDHISRAPVRDEPGSCMTLGWFWQNRVMKMVSDHSMAVAKYGSCSEMQLEEGLVDRDLGTNAREQELVDFIDDLNNDNPGFRAKLHTRVDAQNFLRNAAFYAVTQTLDSPLGNGNNWFIASDGTGSGFKIVQYDHNNMGGYVPLGSEGCASKLVDWSIAYPTKVDKNNFFGPLLEDFHYFNDYLGHVREINEVFKAMQDEVAAVATAILPFVKSDPAGAIWAIFFNVGGVCEDKAFPLKGLVPGMDTVTCPTLGTLFGVSKGACPEETIKASPMCDATCQANPGFLAMFCKDLCGLCDGDKPSTETPATGVINGGSTIVTGMHWFEANTSPEAAEAAGGWNAAQKPLVAFIQARSAAITAQLSQLAENKVPMKPSVDDFCPLPEYYTNATRDANWCGLTYQNGACYLTTWCDPKTDEMLRRTYYDSKCTELMTSLTTYSKPYDVYEWDECGVFGQYKVQFTCERDATVDVKAFAGSDSLCETALNVETMSETSCVVSDDPANDCAEGNKASTDKCVYTPTPKPAVLSPTTAGLDATGIDVESGVMAMSLNVLLGVTLVHLVL